MNEKYIDIYIELLILINNNKNIKDIIKNNIINYDINFKDSYEARRINITYLFGDRLFKEN